MRQETYIPSGEIPGHLNPALIGGIISDIERLTEANAWEQVIDIPVTPAQESQAQVHNAQMALPPDEQNSIFANLLDATSVFGDALNTVDSAVGAAANGLAGAAMYAGGAIVGAIGTAANHVADFAVGAFERSGNLLAGHGFRSDAEYQDYLAQTASLDEGFDMGLGSNDNFNYSKEFYSKSLYGGGLPYTKDFIAEGESQRNNLALTPDGTSQYNMCFLTSTANALTDKLGVTAEDGQEVIMDLVDGDSDGAQQRKGKLMELIDSNLNPESSNHDHFASVQGAYDQLQDMKKNGADAAAIQQQEDIVMKGFVDNIGQLEDTMDVIRHVNNYGSYKQSTTIMNVLRHFDAVAEITPTIGTTSTSDNAYKYSDETNLVSYLFNKHKNTAASNYYATSPGDAKAEYQYFNSLLDQNDENAAVILSTKLSNSGHMVYLKGIDTDGLIINDSYGYALNKKQNGNTYRDYDNNQGYTYRVNWENVDKYQIGYSGGSLTGSWKYNMLIRRRKP